MKKYLILLVILTSILLFDGKILNCQMKNIKAKAVLVAKDSTSNKTKIEKEVKKNASPKKATIKKTAKKTANCNMPECKQDSFVDKDGDGINDNRCTGMGVSTCKKKNCKMKK